MSQLLLRIRERLLVETDPNRRAELLAKQAAYCARVGQFSDARQAISEIRQLFGDGRSGRVTAFTMLAEGLVSHYEQLGAGALDRISRAQLLGHAMKDREVIAVASAWRAHLEFESSDFESAVRSLRIALQTADETDNTARVRCAIVLFNAFALFGERDESQRWFMAGREYALRDGDQASIDALLHSRATFGVARLRARRCTGSVEESALAHARAEIGSARNLQFLTHVKAHESFIDLCDARLKIIETDFQNAIELLTSIRNSGPYPIGNFSQALVDFEIAYCSAMLGLGPAPGKSVRQIDRDSLATLDVDDRLAVSWMSLELASLNGAIEAVSAAREDFDRATREYDLWLSSMRTLFAEFSVP